MTTCSTGAHDILDRRSDAFAAGHAADCVDEGTVVMSTVSSSHRGGGSRGVRVRGRWFEKLRGRRVRFGGLLNANPADAGRVVIRCREGSLVSVRYDTPPDPQRCTLERRMSRLVVMWLCIGIFFVAGIFGAMMGWWE
jgi:hypothetical protein